MQLPTAILLSLLSTTLAAPISQQSKVLKFPTKIHNFGNSGPKLSKRDGTIINDGTNVHQVFLSFPLTLGGNSVEAVVDTGSDSAWVYNGVSDSGSSLCSDNSCITSTSELQISDNDYSISYTGGFGASGYWATGPLSIGGSNSVNFDFGLANSISGSSSGYSWFGFGYSSDELSQESTTHIIDALYEGGVIDQRIFQIEYNDITDWSSSVMGQGELTIGGYDTSKDVKFFTMTSDIDYYLAIPMQSIGNSEGSNMALQDEQTVVFDSGSTSFSLKQKYYDAILSDITFPYSSLPNFFTCSDYEDFNLTFEIDSETSFSIPLLDLSWNNYQDSYDLCQLMVSTLSDDNAFEITFGQYAMKNLVTVFDIDNKQIGLASNTDNVVFA